MDISELANFDEEMATILVVDDEDIVRESIAAHLDDSGFGVIEAKNAEEGLKLFREKKPDLILTDIQMPGMSGIEFLSVIVDEDSELPIIVVSGAGVMQDAVNALRLGAWDYLIKPIPDLSVLEHAVCKCLERTRLVKENKLYRAELEKMNTKLRESLDILEEDQEAGRSVQTSLLPQKEHKVGPYSISHKIEPSLFLSGDFVDHFQINETHFGFYIADVSGHGASSAFVTVLLKSLMSQTLSNYQAGKGDVILHPEQVLGYLSKEIHKAKMGKYLTMVYCVLDLENNNLVYSIGGHYPYPVMHAGNECKFWEEKGFPVGIMESAKYKNIEVELPETFTLAMFSDGVLEVMPEEDLEAQEKKLLKMVGAGNVTVDSLFEELNLESLDALPDDITLLLLHRGKN